MLLLVCRYLRIRLACPAPVSTQTVKENIKNSLRNNTDKTAGRLAFALKTKTMKAYIQTLYTELQEDLEAYMEMGILPINKLSGALHTLRGTLGKLKSHVLQHPFKDQQEEITFFKKEKPLFVAEQLYAVDLCIIQTAQPRYDTALIREYLESELRQINVYFRKYSFLYQYYQLDSTDMDVLLFVRGAYPKDVLVPDAADPDPAFSTACDHLWARFMAYERLREWLVSEIRAMDGGGAGAQPGNPGGDMPPPGPVSGGPGGMRWTGETINLVEIAYGIWLTGQLNNGQVSVTEIVEFLEGMFRVKIGKPHRRWQGIARRKRLGYTRFLDEMKAALEKRVEEEFSK